MAALTPALGEPLLASLCSCGIAPNAVAAMMIAPVLTLRGSGGSAGWHASIRERPNSLRFSRGLEVDILLLLPPVHTGTPVLGQQGPTVHGVSTLGESHMCRDWD